MQTFYTSCKEPLIMLNLRLSLSPLLALLLTTATPALTQAAASSAGADGAVMVTIPYEKYKLKNGLEVILSEDHRLPLVSSNIWYHVGPANERPGRTGF